VRLFELAYCCRLYGHFTGYDDSLGRLRAGVGPELDASNAAHRAALFGWLNEWGCRQFAKNHHATTASDSLVEWAASWLRQLPEREVLVTDLSRGDLDLAAAAYDALRVRLASWRALPSGHSAPVTFGPTGTAKTLFAFRPGIFPPWDEPIRAFRLWRGRSLVSRLSGDQRRAPSRAGLGGRRAGVGPPPARRAPRLESPEAHRRVQLGGYHQALSSAEPGRGSNLGAVESMTATLQERATR
jgi:hypothetical protein